MLFQKLFFTDQSYEFPLFLKRIATPLAKAFEYGGRTDYKVVNNCEPTFTPIIVLCWYSKFYVIFSCL